MGDSGWSSAVLICLGIAIVYVAIWRPWKRLPPGAGGSYSVQGREEADLERSLQEVLASLHELSRDTLAKLDTKIRLLNQYLMEADDRIRRLEQLGAGSAAPPAHAAQPIVPPAAIPASVPAAAATPEAARPLPAPPAPAPAAPAPFPFPSPAPAPPAPAISLPSAPVPAPAPPAEPATPHAPPGAGLPSVQALHQRVYELADRGFNKAEIARELDRPRGEIELILQLRAPLPGPPAAGEPAAARPRGGTERGRKS